MKAVLKEQAIALRRDGKNYAEICRQLGVAKSSVSNWVKDVVSDVRKRGLITQTKRIGPKRMAKINACDVQLLDVADFKAGIWFNW